MSRTLRDAFHGCAHGARLCAGLRTDHLRPVEARRERVAMAEEVISVSENFYVLSTSQRIDDRVRVLKEGDTFAVFDRFGDIERFGGGEYGIYYRDTRFLSGFSLAFEEKRPLLLSSSVKDDNALFAVDLMNADVLRGDDVLIPRGTVHIFRSKVLWHETLYQRLRLHNYGSHAAEMRFVIEFCADFADIFEVRGRHREKRGRSLPVEVARDRVTLGYGGLDGCIRRTHLVFDPAPDQLTESQA